MNQKITQAILVEQDSFVEHQTVEKIALFNEDGSAFETGLNALVTVATAIGTAAKTTTADEPTANTLVPIKFTNGNSAENPTVSFNGGTARAIKLAGVAVAAADCTIAANGIGLFFFDGTDLHQTGILA